MVFKKFNFIVIIVKQDAWMNRIIRYDIKWNFTFFFCDFMSESNDFFERIKITPYYIACFVRERNKLTIFGCINSRPRISLFN